MPQKLSISIQDFEALRTKGCLRAEKFKWLFVTVENISARITEEKYAEPYRIDTGKPKRIIKT